MFKNLTIYRLAAGWPVTPQSLEQALQSQGFVECGATQTQSQGWVPPRGHAHGALAEQQGGHALMMLMIETKTVPATVVRRKVREEVVRIEAHSARKPGKKEQRDLADQIRFALLPQAFARQQQVRVWVDSGAGLLMTDASSQTALDTVVSTLVRTIDGLVLQLLQTQQAPASAMGAWLSARELPEGFGLERECELRASDESKAVVSYTRHLVDTDEVAQHISQGKLPSRLGLCWNDQVTFVLTQTLQLKKVTLPEVSTAPGDPATREEDFDTDFALISATLGGLIAALVEALGGTAPVPEFTQENGH